MKDKIVELENGLRQVTTYYLDGKTPHRVYTIDKDGRKQGTFKSYHDNGQLDEDCTYKDGKLDSTFAWYDYRGVCLGKGAAKDGKFDGLQEGYNKHGQLVRKCIYKDGKFVENKLNPTRKGLNNILKSLNKNMEPTSKRRQVKLEIVKVYRDISVKVYRDISR